MIKKLTYLFFVCLALLIHQSGFSQEEDEYDSLLIKKTIVENPVYKPVIGFGAGITHFYGDVENSNGNPLMGSNTFKLTVSTFLGGTRSFIGNFHALFGSLTGIERSYDNPELNLNFKSDVMVFGFNAEYNFSQFFSKPEGILRPFVSVGIENISFNSKGELSFRDTTGVDHAYYYWKDGTIRDMEETPGNMLQAKHLYRDWDWETPLREKVGLGDYGKNTFAIPVDLGIDFRVSDRVKMRLGASGHFLLTDVIDNVSYKPGQTSNDGKEDNEDINDWFSFMYLTMHLDLFSEPKVITEELKFAELDDFDYSLLEDEDGDGVFDLADECLGTPPGVEVDTLGCPYDDDNDGVPNYRDKQKDTPEGVFVNDDGVEMSEEELIARVNFPEAVPRSQLSLYLEGTITAVKRMTLAEMPEKFHKLDLDNDSYLSFDEMLTSIDEFFDFRSDLNTGEIYRLISFFFAQ
jgi:hypothetical protein